MNDEMWWLRQCACCVLDLPFLPQGHSPLSPQTLSLPHPRSHSLLTPPTFFFSCALTLLFSIFLSPIFPSSQSVIPSLSSFIIPFTFPPLPSSPHAPLHVFRIPFLLPLSPHFTFPTKTSSFLTSTTPPSSTGGGCGGMLTRVDFALVGMG